VCTRQRNCRRRWPGARHSDRRAHGAQFSLPPQRHSERNRRPRSGSEGHEGESRLHAQNYALPSRNRKICRARGRGRQSPLWPRRCILIKDNHITIAGSVTEALRRARAAAGHLAKIEVEIDNLEQLKEALAGGADAVLLDNMSLDMLAEAAAMASGRAITEASGRITVTSAPAIAATGVDLISPGWLTHSAPALIPTLSNRYGALPSKFAASHLLSGAVRCTAAGRGAFCVAAGGVNLCTSV
jgi:Quinolinate phosphoribosyl transferase, C-terminal domain